MSDTELTPREQRAKERNLPAITVGPRYYDASKNPGDTRYVTGVPLRDLSAEEFVAYPEHIQRTIDGVEYFRKTKPPVNQPASKPKQEG